METQQKIKVAVLFGGRSGEHEISLRSAASVLSKLDQKRFDLIPIGISKEGHWFLGDPAQVSQNQVALEIPIQGIPVTLLRTEGKRTAKLTSLNSTPVPIALSEIDVVFPVVHGTFCEDGTLQGLLESADVAYVGSGVLGSAVGMDKDVAKRLAKEAGIAVGPFITLRDYFWKREPLAVHDRVARELGFPVFVKPANAGSSVGVHKVKDAGELEAALTDAFRYDTKILVEKAIRAREIELSVLEGRRAGDPPRVSIPGEIRALVEFYSYEAKYQMEKGAELIIPALLSQLQMTQAQKMAADAFTTLECEGMARVDLFLDQDTGHWTFNELNTLPGFTQISMYPKLWEASGLGYPELLTQLVEIALDRHDRKSRLVRDFEGAV